MVAPFFLSVLILIMANSWMYFFVLFSTSVLYRCECLLQKGNGFLKTKQVSELIRPWDVEEGKTVHFYATLSKCIQTSGPLNPEFTSPFGGEIDYYRVWLNKDYDYHSYMEFSNMHLAYNSTGHLVQIVRKFVLIADKNNTADVITYVYTRDFVVMYSYSHICNVSTSSERGSVDFFSPNSSHAELRSFVNLVDALKHGDDVRFQAYLFACNPPSRDGSMSNMGAHIRDFQYVVTPTTEKIVATLPFAVLPNTNNTDYMLHMRTMEIFSNHSVEFKETSSRVGDSEVSGVERHHCRMYTVDGGGIAAILFWS